MSVTYEDAMATLVSMFGTVDREVIAMILQSNNGHMEKTVENLLAMTGEAAGGRQQQQQQRQPAPSPQQAGRNSQYPGQQQQQQATPRRAEEQKSGPQPAQSPQ